MFIYHFFKKKKNTIALEQAKNLGFITEGEFFKLRYERAKEDWENYTSKKKKSK